MADEVIQGLVAHRGAEYLGRQDLLALPTPAATATHVPIPHAKFVGTLVETLGYRKLEVVADQYAVTPDGMRMFGILALDIEDHGVRLSIGVRNSHDKSCALGITIGYKVFVCDYMAFHGDFEPVTRKHSKNLVLEDVLAIAVDRMQRHFAPTLNRVNAWQNHELADVAAKVMIYDAFKPRTMWSLSNAFTSAFKELDPVPRFKATAALAPYLARFGN